MTKCRKGKGVPAASCLSWLRCHVGTALPSVGSSAAPLPRALGNAAEGRETALRRDLPWLVTRCLVAATARGTTLSISALSPAAFCTALVAVTSSTLDRR